MNKIRVQIIETIVREIPILENYPEHLESITLDSAPFSSEAWPIKSPRGTIVHGSLKAMRLFKIC